LTARSDVPTLGGEPHRAQEPQRTRRRPPDAGHETASASRRVAGWGYAIVQPGFQWSTHLREETDAPLCQIHHLQLLLSGRFAVEMDDGEYVEIGPNEIFDVPPGHDAWVVGDEPAVLLDFLGNIEQ
jgi:mannose-6-phosphate isomerase-like protein (cupin superfamily)